MRGEQLGSSLELKSSHLESACPARERRVRSCFLYQGVAISHVKDLTTAAIRLHALQKWLLRNYSGWFLSHSMYSSTPRCMSYCGR